MAERPRHASDRLVGYELLPIYEEWWPKAQEGKWRERTFDDYFQYEPFGGRPGVPASIGGVFFGRKESSNKAKPFWGWHDTQTLKKRILAVGQWGLDPAYAVSRNLRFPARQPFSLDYVYNPFLGIDRRESQPAPEQPSTAVPATSQPMPPAATPAATSQPAAEAGYVDIRAQIDGTVDICLTGDQVRWEVQSGQPVMRETVSFSGPLPSSPAGSWSLTKREGRGSATLLEKPSAENGYTARIRVEDPRGGVDFYRLRLEWRR